MAAQASGLSATPLNFVCILSEGTLYPIIQFINEQVKQDWTQYYPLGFTASHWPPGRICTAAAAADPLIPTI